MSEALLLTDKQTKMEFCWGLFFGKRKRSKEAGAMPFFFVLHCRKILCQHLPDFWCFFSYTLQTQKTGFGILVLQVKFISTVRSGCSRFWSGWWVVSSPCFLRWQTGGGNALAPRKVAYSWHFMFDMSNKKKVAGEVAKIQFFMHQSYVVCWSWDATTPEDI